MKSYLIFKKIIKKFRYTLICKIKLSFHKGMLSKVLLLMKQKVFILKYLIKNKLVIIYQNVILPG